MSHYLRFGRNLSYTARGLLSPSVSSSRHRSWSPDVSRPRSASWCPSHHNKSLEDREEEPSCNDIVEFVFWIRNICNISVFSESQKMSGFRPGLDSEDQTSSSCHLPFGSASANIDDCVSLSSFGIQFKKKFPNSSPVHVFGVGNMISSKGRRLFGLFLLLAQLRSSEVCASSIILTR